MQDIPVRSRLVGVNVPPTERIVSGIAGAVAIVAGVSRRSLAGAAVAVAGTMAVARAITGRCPGYRARALRKGIQIRRAVTVQATPQQVYELWRDLSNLPRFMKHIVTVTVDGSRSHWTVREGGRLLEWDAEITEDVPARRIRWRSLPGGDIRHDGMIDLRAAPGDRGTTLEVKLHWMPPGGLFVASALYELLRKVTQVQIAEDLARLQQLIETGEIATGARRIDQLARDERAIEASEAAPAMPPAAVTADASIWQGGAR